MQSSFADTILNITRTGGLVRMDLGTLKPVVDQEGKQTLQAIVTQQLVMPLDGFVRAFEVQEGLVNRLIEEGILQRNAQGETTAPSNEPTPSH
ncbi:MAG: hypothetical protein HQL47_09995 [Gammaproteobacteria bacterium]|nr:hypothetical protein [Gammaproteobacteria bacterium]